VRVAKRELRNEERRRSQTIGGDAMSTHEPGWLWVVVVVESGIPASAEAYRDEGSARRRERLLWKEIDPNDDAVGVFRVQVGQPASCVCETSSGAEFKAFVSREAAAAGR